MARFVALSEQEKQAILDERDSVNTKSQTKYATRIFREYLEGKNKDVHFENYSLCDLDGELSNFYMEARTKSGELFKKNSLAAIRFGIGRHLQNTIGNIDIMRGENFKKSQNAYTAVVKVLKKQGKAAVEHHNIIPEGDKLKINQYFNSSTVPYNLRLPHKMFFIITYYLCRRGREGLRELTKEHFVIKTDSSGSSYVYQRVDQLQKNHQDDDDHGNTGRLYEVPGSPDCPVNTFRTYVAHLHPDCEFLFTRPREMDEHMYNDKYWYEKRILGKNSLGSMMATISKNADLSTVYTNHCIRSTCVTQLDENNFSDRHIASVSGHKSLSSLKSYNHKTSEKKKHEMSSALSNSMGIYAPPRQTCSSTVDTIENIVQDLSTMDHSDILTPFHIDCDLLDLPEVDDETLLKAADMVYSSSEYQMSTSTCSSGGVTVNKTLQCALTKTPPSRVPNFIFNNCTVNIMNK